MLTARKIDGNQYAVTMDDGSVRVVAVAAGGSEADALSALRQADAGPTTEMVMRQARQAARAECRRRILDVADLTAQVNMASAAAAGEMEAGALATYRSGLRWVAAMRRAWPDVAAGTRDWPEVPAGVADLAARF